MDVVLLLFLILLNGLFAMSEMALTAARKTRLQVMAEETDDAGARAALRLHEEPNKWLSTVQIGITSIGLLNGIVGEAAFSEPVAGFLRAHLPLSENAASFIATATVVVTITFLTILFGELVPKRVGQIYPEVVARLVARPMEWLSLLARPFVMLLSGVTTTVLGLLGIKHVPRSVTEEEIAASLEEGVDAGVIEAHEHRMVRNVFRLDERHISSMMIPRGDIVWLDAAAPMEQTLDIIARTEHNRYPVCRGDLDEVIGVISARQLLQQVATGRPLDLNGQLQPPVFVPETLTGMELLESFRMANLQMVFVVDEYGVMQGVITLQDVLEAITGEFTTAHEEEAWAVQRADGSWLLDGMIPVPELKDRLQLKVLPEEDRGRYNTLAGMVMLLLGRLPGTADVVEWGGWRFEVVDLDGKRVDKVLVTALPPAEQELSVSGG
ncbi:hemolysin family protein [Caldimonas tepidiphila]|uniref:hemolysin family protein n=1 Tax=Caldimonas tepidiphila TaxID=2315841 RepID=UPI000E5A81EB|nr:hemolysin family protein [Caldimonas tepidiphila]